MEVLTYTEEEITIEDGFTIAVKKWGNPSGEPVLAIHGWLDNANTFDKIAPMISDHLYLVAIDLAGHGSSSHRSQDTSYYTWDYAIDILKVVKKLEWKKFSMIAHSLGTGVASIVAASAAEAVKKIVFIDGLGAPFVFKNEDIVTDFRKSVRQLQIAKKTQLYGFSSPKTPQFKTKEEAIRDRMDNAIGVISYDASKVLVKRSIKEVSQGFRWKYDPRLVIPIPFRLTEFQAQSFISAITSKTLIILGEQGMFSKGMFADRIPKFKNATVHWLPGGHHLHLEKEHPEISSIIINFFKQNNN